MKHFTSILIVILFASLTNPQSIEIYKLKQSVIFQSTITSFPNSFTFSDDDIPGKKSPWLAFFLSYIFPGGGQLYNGQPLKGVLFIGGVAAGLGISLVGFSGADFEASDRDKAFFYSGLGIAGVFYLWQLIDAPVSASNINDERRLKLNKAELEILPTLTKNCVYTSFKIYFN